MNSLRSILRGGGLCLALLAASATLHAAPSALHVEGAKLKDAQGKDVLLRGVNIPSMEWANLGEHVLQSVSVAADTWHANIIRLPLSEDRWFGKASGQSDGGTAYRNLVDAAVKAISDKGAYVLLDMHWSNMNVWGQNIGQHNMPDAHTTDFWKDAAARYANQPAVLYDLYNEPHDVSWTIWRNGGSVTEAGTTYAAVGMQTLLETVRQTGAKNVIVAGGLDWAYDLRGLNNGFALTDSGGNGIVYASHIYPWKQNWDANVTAVTDRYPVIISEFGADPSNGTPGPDAWVDQILVWLNQHNYSWAAWSFHPGATPRLLQDWSYTPTSFFGAKIKTALTGSATPPTRTLPLNPSANRVSRLLADFEGNDFDGWMSDPAGTGQNTKASRNADPLYVAQGAASLKVDLSGLGGFKESVIQAQLPSAQDWTGYSALSMDVYAPGSSLGSGWYQLELRTKGTGGAATYGNRDLKPGWNHLQWDFQTGKTAGTQQIGFALSADSVHPFAGPVYLDNVRLWKDAFPGLHDDERRIQGFDSSQDVAFVHANGQTTVGLSTTPGTVKDGGGSLKVGFTGLKDWANNEVGADALPALDVSQAVALRLDVFVPGGSAPAAWWQVGFGVKGDGGWIYSDVEGLLADQWNSIQIPLSPGEAAGLTHVTGFDLIRNSGDVWRGPIYIDNLRFALKPLRGDVNGDRVLDGRDMALALQAFILQDSSALKWPPLADVSPEPSSDSRGYGDGQLQANDLNRLFRTFLSIEPFPD